MFLPYIELLRIIANFFQQANPSRCSFSKKSNKYKKLTRIHFMLLVELSYRGCYLTTYLMTQNKLRNKKVQLEKFGDKNNQKW